MNKRLRIAWSIFFFLFFLKEIIQYTQGERFHMTMKRKTHNLNTNDGVNNIIHIIFADIDIEPKRFMVCYIDE